MTAAQLAPVAPDFDMADADRQRAERFLRKKLAEACSPSERRMIEHELRQLARPPANVTPIR